MAKQIITQEREEKTLTRLDRAEPDYVTTTQGIIDTRLVNYIAKTSSYENGGLAIVWATDHEEHPFREHLKVYEVHQIALESEEAISELKRISKEFRLEIMPAQIHPIGMQFYTYQTSGANTLKAKQVVKKMAEEHS